MIYFNFFFMVDKIFSLLSPKYKNVRNVTKALFPEGDVIAVASKS